MFKYLCRSENIPLCHKLHYLQMMTEKLAKGFRTPPRAGKPQNPVHEAFAKFVRTIPKSHPGLYKNFKGDIDGYIGSLLPLVAEIEKLVPKKEATEPNPEYPWESNNSVVCPVEYDFPKLRLEDPKMVKLLQLLHVCFESVEQEL